MADSFLSFPYRPKAGAGIIGPKATYLLSLSLSGETALTRDQGTRVIDAIRRHLCPAI
ncbi:hypothetical protein OG216_44000 [Streptomycetaceae bacterium NBC_01309]